MKIGNIKSLQIGRRLVIVASIGSFVLCVQYATGTSHFRSLFAPASGFAKSINGLQPASVPNTSTVLVPSLDGIPYFWGIPAQHLANALTLNPVASSFLLHWQTLEAGSTGTDTVRYDRTTGTLRHWSHDSNWESGRPQGCLRIYTKVTDSILADLAAEDPSGRAGSLEELTKFGCSCQIIDEKSTQSR